MTTSERIKELEEHLRNAQYNKHTEHAFGVIKAQIARLKERKEAVAAKKLGGGGFGIKKSGDATVVLLGFPSTGKSTLLNKLTNAKSKVAAYEFTTLDVVPGLLEYKHAKIQILDVPGIIAGASQGKGRGREVLAMVRNADLILILIDALHPEQCSAILKEVEDAGVRINQRPPDIKISKKTRGGIDIGTTVQLTKISKETIMAILREFRINNADVLIRTNITADELIDAIDGTRQYVPAIKVVSKTDLLSDEGISVITKELRPDLLVSAEQGRNVQELKELIFQKLNFIRIYLKEVNKKADLEVPLVLKGGVTLRSVCSHIHKDFVKKFRFAKIWGKSAKFEGQQFKNLDKQLTDCDVVELHIK
ncbi:GTP-binding protein [Candidatus Woesearchaeota archaeon]|nr:GTP-binding protein [Candidatus Woesearchaeota archaeon]